MGVKTGFLGVVILLLSSGASADWGDDDWDDDYDPEPTAEQFCHALTITVEHCETTCLPEGYVEACLSDPPWDIRPCLNISGCANVNACLCGTEPVDDDADENPAGESDDDADDSSADDDDDDDDDDGCGGCGVSNSETGSFLSAGMMGIGVLALVLSRREGKSVSSTPRRTP
ncbi:MAG: hypothetical protein IT350_14480 [Deltaproteobacteria bacterium]|nr:hypothetical protein [Deltaproteobacteria bacterium]